MQKILKNVSYLIIAILVGVTVAYAGSLTPPGSAANTMYSLTDIWNLAAGTTTTLGTGTIETTPGTPEASGKTLTEIYTAIAGEIDNLTNGTIAKDVTAFGFTGTLYGDVDPTKVLTSATYAGTATSGGLPKTGQALCYGTTDGSSQNPCLDGSNANGGQDGYYQKGLPTSGVRFVDNVNNTITDNATGLMWKKCVEGLSGTTCATGSYSTLTWAQALSACEADTTASFTNWRLSNMLELRSLVDYGVIVGVNPVINSTFFPNTPYSSVAYWSSTTYNESGNEAYAIIMSFYDGLDNLKNKTQSASSATRCVRSI